MLSPGCQSVTQCLTRGEPRADAALFLATDEGRFVNSHDLVVDSGRTLMFNEYPHESGSTG